MSPTRRDFVRMAAMATVAVGGRPRTPWDAPAAVDRHPHAGDPVIKELAAKALDAAKAAGATYADVRFTLIRQEDILFNYPDMKLGYGLPPDREEALVGVRALADGAWGFTSGPVWSVDEVTRLGREATAQARINAIGRQTRIELGERPPAVTGEWVMPVAIDPFTVPLVEKLDLFWALQEEADRLYAPKESLMGGMAVRHRRQEKTFASTDGTYVSQTQYFTHPFVGLVAFYSDRIPGRRTLDRLQPTAGGWEVMLDGTILRDLPRVAEEAVLQLEQEKVLPGRYDVIFDGYTVGALLGRTVGMAAELDRVLGYEANAGGTSYLAPVEETLGAFSYGSPLINVTADRSRPGGLATTKWDDEGIVPEEYPVVKDGVLVDYHTTRALIPTMASWYGKSGRPLRSHGCAGSQNAGGVTLLQPPNVTLAPAATDTSFEELVANLEYGLVIHGGTQRAAARIEEININSAVTFDRQQLNGEINASYAYEVRKGKRTRVLSGIECLVRAPELWKSLQALGGTSTQVTTGCTMVKGQPTQVLHFSATAVPARFKQVAITDRTRKA